MWQKRWLILFGEKDAVGISEASQAASDIYTHYSDVIMSVIMSQITGVSMVWSSVCSGTDQSSASLAFVRGIHQWPMDSPHKGPVKRKIFSFDDVIMWNPIGYTNKRGYRVKFQWLRLYRYRLWNSVVCSFIFNCGVNIVETWETVNFHITNASKKAKTLIV